MLQSLSEQIRLCYERAAEAMRRAEETTDPETKADFLNTERRWLLLARSYQFSDSLKDFIRAIPDRLFGTGSTLKDATVRHRDRQALRNPEEDLQTIIDGSAYLVSIVNSSSDAILSKNLNGVILSWNRGAELIFGYSADEVVGKSITILMPSDLLDEEPKILERIRRGEHIDNYETKRRHKDGRLLDISLTVSPVKDADGQIVGASKVARDITNQKRAKEIEETLIREIQHRSNNQLAVIQAIAHQTLSGDPSLAQVKKVFDARLQALARANRQLNESSWSRVNLSEIVRSAMAPFGGRAMIDGVDVMVGAEHVQNFSLALHELATNAAKYGALSNESGKVKIFWTIGRDDKDNILKFKWKETGGPPVVAPAHRGFGTSLLKTTFPDVRIDYSVEGLTCEIDL